LERFDFPAKLVGQQLQAEVDAQYRQLAREYAWIAAGRVLVINAGGATGQDDAFGIAALDLLPRRIVRQQLAVDVALAHAARDEASGLGAEIEDDDRLGRRVRCGRGCQAGTAGTRRGSRRPPWPPARWEYGPRG